MKSHFSLLSGLLLATSLAIAATPAPTASFRYAPATFKGDSTRMIVKVTIPKGTIVKQAAVHAESKKIRGIPSPLSPAGVEDFPTVLKVKRFVIVHVLR